MKKFLVYAAVGLGFMAYNVYTQADRDASGAIVSGGNLDAFTVQLGDCFNDTSAPGADQSGEVTSLPGVPCAEPHDNEVYAVFDVDYESFPGDDAMAEQAFDECLARFEGFVGTVYEESQLDITMLYPSNESWGRQGDREVICAVYDMNMSKLTGSVEGSAI
ncbi:MAG: septum formation family protein [Woeseiaceae bacterium]|jgi:hypothetical protein